MNLTSRERSSPASPGTDAMRTDPAVGDRESKPGSHRPDTTDGPDHPARSMIGLFLASYVVLSAVMVGLGLLVTHSLHGVTRWDVSVNRWFVHQRSGALNDATQIGSHLAETLTVIAVATVIVIWLSIRKDWRSVGFLVSAITLEVTVFLTTTLLVDRQRPPVLKLDTAPPTSSFPSGHTAASIALYIGVLFIIGRRMRPGLVRTLLQIVLLAVPVAVGLSRLYRGMHHPTDVIAGVLLGALCLAVATRIATMLRPEPAERIRS